MPETWEAPAWLTHVVAAAVFCGGVLAALFRGGKNPEAKAPEKDDVNMGAWMQHVNEKISEFDTRFKRIELDRLEQRADFREALDKLEELGESNARIEGALGIGNDGR